MKVSPGISSTFWLTWYDIRILFCEINPSTPATIIQLYFQILQVEPSWRMNEVFVVEVAHSALSADGIFAHSAMNSKVTSLQSIRLKFDVISYCKGKMCKSKLFRIRVWSYIGHRRIFLKGSPSFQTYKYYLSSFQQENQFFCQISPNQYRCTLGALHTWSLF